MPPEAEERVVVLKRDGSLEDLRKDIHHINNRVHDLETYAAVSTEKLSHISKAVDNVASSLSRGLWIVGGSILAAVAAFIVNGGLQVVT